MFERTLDAGFRAACERSKERDRAIRKGAKVSFVDRCSEFSKMTKGFKRFEETCKSARQILPNGEHLS